MKTAARAALLGVLAILGALAFALVQALRGLNELEERRRRSSSASLFDHDPYFSERAHRELVEELRR